MIQCRFAKYGCIFDVNGYGRKMFSVDVILSRLKISNTLFDLRNVGSFKKDDIGVGTGLVGAPACGDVMKLQVKCIVICNVFPGVHNKFRAVQCILNAVKYTFHAVCVYYMLV